MKQMLDSPTILLSTRIYRVLLALYPAEYRQEYGPLMLQVFRDVLRDRCRENGWAGVLLWWCATGFDLLITAFEERRKFRFGMSKANFTKLTGLFFVVGGVCAMIMAFSQLQPDDHYTYYGIYQIAMWFMAPAFILIGLGCAGLFLREATSLHIIGRLGLLAAGIGAVLTGVGATLTVAASTGEDFWPLWYYAMLAHIGGVLVFGLVHLRTPVLPVFRALPLQIAAGYVFLLVLAGYFQPRSLQNLLWFVMMLGVGLGWLGIGLKIQRQQQPVVAAALQ